MSNMNAQINIEEARIENAEKYIEHLMHQGSKVPLKFEKLSPPSWYDDEKFRRGQQFMRENYFHVYSSALFGACIVIMGVKVHEELLESGKFDTTLEAIRFYYNASLMIQSWFTGNIYEKKSKPYRTLYKAGIAHTRNSSRLVGGQLGITQKDLAAGIYAFMTIIMSDFDHFYTQSTNELDKQKFEGYLHFWRVIAYHNGLMDEYVEHSIFNPCNGNAYEVRKKCEKVFQHIYKPMLDGAPQNNDYLFKEVLAFVKCWCYLIDKDGLIEFARRKHKLPQKHLTTIKSRIFVRMMLFLHEKRLKSWWISPIVRPILNFLAKASENLLPVTIKLISCKRLIGL